MHADTPELEYYRKVEDLFSSLRGVVHVLSPRDFQLLRTWWRDSVPFAAVAAGLSEVFAKHRERKEGDPITSLSYCRHAVGRQARRFAEMHVGDGELEPTPPTRTDNADLIIERLEAAVSRLNDDWPTVAEIITRVVELVRSAVEELPSEALDEHLFNLESTMLHECYNALDSTQRQTLDARVDVAVLSSATSEAARQRSRLALRDREIRVFFDLPRLEAGG